MLKPIFGETGALIAQLAITIVLVLVLLVVVVWVVRRYSQGRLTAGGRGRLPRLAIVDAMAVDSRRRLVLVRRDNVEHLILIGGPSDLVVEPGIVRQRTAAGQRQAAAQQAAAQQAAAQQAAAAQSPAPVEPAQPGPSIRSPALIATPPPPPAPAIARGRTEAVGADQPIPFPPRRSPANGRASARREPTRRVAGEIEAEELRPSRPFTAPPPSPAGDDLDSARAMRLSPGSARFEETARPTAIQPTFSSVSEGEAEPEPELPPPLDVDEPEMVAPAALADAPRDMAAEFELSDSESEESARPTELHAAVPAAAASARPETSVKVSDLEKEMARLLGEISTGRPP